MSPSRARPASRRCRLSTSSRVRFAATNRYVVGRASKLQRTDVSDVRRTSLVRSKLGATPTSSTSSYLPTHPMVARRRHPEDRSAYGLEQARFLCLIRDSDAAGRRRLVRRLPRRGRSDGAQPVGTVMQSKDVADTSLRTCQPSSTPICMDCQRSYLLLLRPPMRFLHLKPAMRVERRLEVCA
jgi:hypothetical protein